MDQTVPERIYEFLDRNGGELCDDCIREELGLTNRNQVSQVTSAFAATPLFQRWHDLCLSCGRGKLVIDKMRP